MNKEDLEGFAWDNENNDTQDFFGVNKIIPGDGTENPDKDNPKDKTPAAEEVKEDDEPFDFGKDPNEVDNPNTDPKEGDELEDPDPKVNLDKEPTRETSIYDDVYTDMTNNKIFEFVEIAEGESLNAEDFLELTKAEVKARVDAGIEAWADEELDEDARAFVQFKLKGGNTKDFFKTLEVTPNIPTGDISNEAYQEKLVIEQLKAEGKDEYEIQDQIEFFKSKGKLESYAIKAQSKLEETKEKLKIQAIQEAEQARQKATQLEQEFRTNITNTLKEEDDFYGLRMTPTEKRRIESLITKRDHKLPNGQMITGVQKILAEVASDPKKLIALTKVIESDFNFEQIIKKAKTEENKKIKSILQNKSTPRNGSGSSPSSGSSLSDTFF